MQEIKLLKFILIKSKSINAYFSIMCKMDGEVEPRWVPLICKIPSILQKEEMENELLDFK